jgi:AbrB family looped-hinge helix DNA binding protein
MGHSTVVGAKGRITLPKNLREKHGLVDGEPVVLLDTEQGILVRHGRPGLRGLLKDRVDLESLQKDVRKLREEWPDRTIRPTRGQPR